MCIRILVALLAGFYPGIFFLSNNWHIFSFQQNAVLLIGASLASLILLFSISFSLDRVLCLILKKFGFDTALSNRRQGTFDALLAASSLLLCAYLLRNTLASIHLQKIIPYIIVLIVAFYFTWHTYRKGLRLLLYFLIILSAVAGADFLTSIHVRTKSLIGTWAEKNKAAYDQIEFNQKPNVYLIIAESYPNRSALKAVYGIDNAYFYEKMGGLGFKINHDYFSNYDHTLSSLPSLFAMEHHFGMINLGNFDSLGGRRMLEARSYNPVIEIFRANGYKIQFLHNVSLLIPSGAAVDFCIPTPSLFYGLGIFLTNQNILENTIFDRKKTASMGLIKKRIASISLKDGPYFNFIYFDLPGHSPSGLRDNSVVITKKRLGEFRSAYEKKIKSANRLFIDFLEFVIKRDPDSIIIMIGDHGSWGYRFREGTQGRPISNHLFVLDRFGVFAGIRAPNILSDQMEKGSIASHVNILRYVFAYLSEDENILKTRAPDGHYEGQRTMDLKESQILKNLMNAKPD